MPVRNNRDTLALALQSIKGQTYDKWELLLIEDGSNDGSQAIAKKFAEADERIRLITDGVRRGLPERLNQAISLSRGEYFARMDGDDISYPSRLERQMEYLRQHPDVDLVGAGAIVFNGYGTIRGKRLGPEFHNEICDHPCSHIRMMHPTFLGHINFFRRFGYRSSASSLCDDQDLLLRACGSARYANVPEILLGYREEQLKLEKILKTRWYMSRNFFSIFLRRRQPFSAVKAVILQALKGMVDVIAISSGLNYRLLRHRALPVSESERNQWQHVWSDLTGS